MNWSVNRSGLKGASMGRADALPGDLYIVFDQLGPNSLSALAKGGNGRCANSHIRVKHPIPALRHGENEALDQLYRELARVNRFLDVVVFDVGNDPKITGILPKRITGVFSRLGTFEMFLARVFLRYPN